MVNNRTKENRVARAGLRKYYYVVWHNNGQDILDGPFEDYTKAMNEAMLGNCPFDIPNFPTRDRGLATQMYKRTKLVSGQGLDSSLERMGHQIPTTEKVFRMRVIRKESYDR